MRIAFCGHSHHRTTGSSRFLIEALASLGTVEEHWVESWSGGMAFDPMSLAGDGHDAVVVWQMESVALRLAEAGLPNVTFFPMYDSCHAYPDSYWRRLSSIKVVSFSSFLQARLQRLGVRARFVRYYPELTRERTSQGRELAGFFWQRQQDITWSTLRPLLAKAPFHRFTIHDALDPACGRLVPPSADEVARLHVRTTRWFPSRAEARADLLSHNVYFAPRLREGIGMSFLEAMAMGFLVVAPDRPTMNEYIVSGVNGLLYDPEAPAPLDFTCFQELGHRARLSVESGRERWCRSLPALLELLAVPTREVPVQAPFCSLDPHSIEPAAGASPRPTRATGGPTGSGPLVTVVLGAAVDVSAASTTLHSIAAQDWPRIEVVAFERDGLERVGGPEWWRGHGIERWSAIPDRGGAHALDEAADAAAGRHVVFLGPGEVLPARDTLSTALGDAPVEMDVIVGHHLRRDEWGNEEVCAAADPVQAYARLRRAEISWRWIEAVPASAAILWDVEFLRRLRFRSGLRLLVHEDALLRAVQQGARVHHALACLAACPGRRGRVRERLRALEGWRGIALQHTERPELLDRMIERMRSDARTQGLHRLSTLDLLLSACRAPGAFRELKRRARTHRTLARARRRGSVVLPRPG